MIPSIINMGGAQMYIRNKVVWLRKQGWDVQVISAYKGNVIISELKEFDTFIPEMLFPFYVFSQSKQRRIVKQVINKIQPHNFDEIVIESTCIGITTWAEVIAKEVCAKHIAYLLQEMNVVDNPYLQKFFKFKHQRRELVSITDQSLMMMFESFAPIPIEQSYRLPAYCNNVVEDIDSPFLHTILWDKYDYKVGCLARIDKPFVMTAVSNFASFVLKHHDKRFLLFMIGGALENTPFESNIEKIFSGLENVELIISGYMFPISAKLLECFDAFFSSAGSCWVCMRSGVPTIAIDGNDFLPTGIMKHTTLHSLFRDDDEPALDYQEVFEDVIIRKKYPRMVSDHEIIEPDFSTHMEFLGSSAEETAYFSNFKSYTMADLKLCIILSLIGAKNYIRLGEFKTRMLHKQTSDR